MTVTLLNNTPLRIAADAIRTCWQSQENSDTSQMLRSLNVGVNRRPWHEKR
jgi:hypothetical protein